MDHYSTRMEKEILVSCIWLVVISVDTYLNHLYNLNIGCLANSQTKYSFGSLGKTWNNLGNLPAYHTSSAKGKAI